MTRLDKSPRPNRPQFLASVPTRRQPSVEEMLREIAYVLHVTRKVKAEILAEREERAADALPPGASVA